MATQEEVRARIAKAKALNKRTKDRATARKSMTASTKGGEFSSINKSADATASRNKKADAAKKRTAALAKRKATIAARDAKLKAATPKGKKVTAAANKRGSANISKKDTPTATKAKPKPAKKVAKTSNNSDSKPTSIAAAKKAGSLYYYKDGVKMAAVYKSDLKDGESLREYMNRQPTKTARKRPPSKPKQKSVAQARRYNNDNFGDRG